MTERQRDPPARPRGRPVVKAPLSSLSVRVPTIVNDRLAQLATKQDRSISELVRTMLAGRLR